MSKKKNRRRPLIVAHRGASATAPENTIAAISQAVRVGAEGLEFDVRLTSDGIPVVFHDSNLKRMADSRQLVDSMTAKELEALDVGSWFNRNNPEFAKQEYVGEGPPRLEQVLDLLSRFQGPIYVELKSDFGNVEDFASIVSEVIGRQNGLHLIVKSFDFELIPLIKKLCPEVETAALFVPNVMRVLRKEKRLINIAEEIGADRLSLHFSLVTKKLMKHALKSGFPVSIWTVDSPRLLKRSTKFGIDTLITNKPADILAIRDHRAANGIITT